MPYCPNCGGEVSEEHHYCGKCGYPLADAVDDTDDDRIPPSGTAAGQSGFLSGRSSQYLTTVARGEADLDSEAIGYSNVSRDVGAALADFAAVTAVEDLDLLSLMIGNTSEASVLGKPTEQLGRGEVRERLMWVGLLRVPELYDRSFGTEWADELTEKLDALSENVEGFQSE